jgi:hypothetical protein
MSCRIERLATAAGTVVFRVSGHLQLEYVKTLQALIDREDGQMELDLSEITLVDREAVSYLAFCEFKGIGLRNCPPYVREWITKERSR